MKKYTWTISKLVMSLFILAAVSIAALPQAEAVKLTVTNNYDKAKSFSILYHEDSTNKWLCRGWYNVPANTTKEYNFSGSTSPAYAYLYSTVWTGDGEEDAVRRTVINNKFRYYDGESCPAGSNRHTVNFSKFAMCVNGAHLIWGEPNQAARQTATPGSNSQIAGISANELLGIELLNNDREQHGLPRLIADPNLTKVAREHAADMVVRHYFNHTNLQGQSPFDRLKANGITYRSAGENIAYNYSVEKLEEAWMNSPGHRANILNTGYTHVGLGLYPGENGSLYGVQVFAGY
ncbi:CAP domain-containing protein [Sporomusa sp. KB1]|jgi:uncharacterized protein YkwD|uniref:CAP domain-containing protein n=1 Tax=Sporomusa sp. KB1 TaxID=943346 RepID=UPI00119ECC65|nr:CAP domain-containing protein [Sporomusa sp. KB1]TWH44957.1 uncharacterized protein DUF1036 [Sporomusa sp. KB1]